MLFISLQPVHMQVDKINYEIISVEKDSRGLINQLFVYVPKISDIKFLNRSLFDKYKKTGIVTFQIYYFDNKQVAKSYKRILYDKSISDDVANKMSQHVIGKFEYVDNKESLHIGKGADEY